MGHFITGVVDEILTPFNADGTVNYEQTAEMIDWQGDPEFLCKRTGGRVPRADHGGEAGTVKGDLRPHPGQGQDYGLLLRELH